MADAKDAPEADEQPVAEEPQVEFDKEIENLGEVTPNEVLEEEPDEEVAEPESDEPAPEDKPAEAEEAPPEPNESEVPKVPEVDDAQKPVETLEAPEALADPGEFKSKTDYSFEVTTTNGKTVKISSPEEADAFAERLDSEEGLITASQFSKFNRHVARMDVGLEREQSEFLEQKKAFEADSEARALETQQLQTWSNEIRYLESKGLLPKIDPAKNTDWLSNKDDPAVQARMEIFDWMDKENALRKEAGIPEVRSAYDAYNLMQADSERLAAAEEKTREGDARRKRGSMVGGNAPFSPDNQPKGSIIGEGGSLRDLVNEASMSM